MIAGDTVLIHSGIYDEKVVPAKSGSNGAYITYRAYGDGEVVIDAQASRDNCIYVANKSYLQFTNLHLTNTGYGGMKAPFAAYAGSSHLILDGVTTDKGRFGILLHGNKTSSEDPGVSVSFVTIKNSIVKNNAAYGIFVYYKVTDTTIGPNNKIFNENATNGVPVDDQYGIDLDTDYPGDPLNGPRRIIIIGNEVYGNRIQGIRPWNSQNLLIKDNYVHNNGATGIQVEDGCTNVVVEGNRSEYNSQGYEYETGIWIDSTNQALVQGNFVRGNQIGIMVTDSDHILLRNNVSYQNNRAYSGSNIMGAVLNNSSNITFVHNTLWKNGASESRGNLMACSNGSITNSVIKNNIFSQSTGVNDINVACQLVSDYNDYYNTRPLSIGWFGKTYNWSNYLAASAQDGHSITVEPIFKDADGGNFNLKDESPTIDRGGFLTKTTSPGSGTSLSVYDARYFSDGYGVEAGDIIEIGKAIAKVVKVDYAKNTISIDKSLTWNAEDPVGYLYTGNAPDQGAYESESSSLTATPISNPSPTQTFLPGDVTGQNGSPDGKVDIYDYNLLISDFGKSGSPGFAVSDINKDGQVNIYDYNIVISNYGK